MNQHNSVVGAVLREMRVDSGLSAEQVATRCGLSGPSIITQYERGDRTVSVPRFYELCAVYEADPALVLSVIEKRARMEKAS